MTSAPEVLSPTQERPDKFAERRSQLAASALLTLSELGYARTSLREIAQNSEFSHGVLHYYFRDKVDLILASVRQYKIACVTRYDEIVAGSVTAPALCADFSAAMARTLREDARMHRLWYDLRSQALFESTLQADVLELDRGLEHMIWRVVSRYSILVDQPAALPPGAVYALFDGVFQQHLLHFLAGDATAPEQLGADVIRALRLVVPTH